MMENSEIEQTPIARMVGEPMKCVQIPPGLRPGDVFIVTPDDCPSFTVVVPEGASPGMFVNVVVPISSQPANNDATPPLQKRDYLQVDKAVVGAAIVGGVVGVCVLGTVGAVVLAGGAAYAASRSNGRIGHAARSVGGKTYHGAAKAKNWLANKISQQR